MNEMKIENHFAQGAIVNNGQMNVGGGTIHVHVQGKEQVVEEQDQNATCNPQLSKESIKRDIFDYVMQLYPLYVRKEWQDKYEELWKAILQLPEVEKEICNKGKQKHGHLFNRDLLGNILCLLKLKEVMTNQANATRMSEILEGSKESSIRAKLGELPKRKVMVAVQELLEKKILK